VGNDRYARILGKIIELRLGGLVKIEKEVDICKAYQETDLVVIPRASKTKIAFPLRIIEAISMSTPLVVSDICGMKELIDGCGLAVRPRDGLSLANAIKTMLTDDLVYFKCVESCKERYREINPQLQLKRIYEEVSNVGKSFL
jgi:glycosyltransferase involved in cell wall biosynthesis